MGVLHIALQTPLKSYRKGGEIENLFFTFQLWNRVETKRKKSFWTQFKNVVLEQRQLLCVLVVH